MKMELFKWWYTDNNGKEYMTFGDCALGHDWVVLTTIVLSVLVLYLYSLISISVFRKARSYPKSITKSYLINMFNVFLFCGISGYGYTALSAFVNPYKLRVLLLLILVVWTYKFYKSIKATNYIERILELEKKVQARISSYNKHALKFQKTKHQEIKWESLKSFKQYNWVLIDKIRFVKTEETENALVFITEMEVESGFGMHSHDCYETVEVIEGELIDDLTNITLSKGEKHTYKPNEVHAPYSNVESTYKVTFTR